MKKLLLFICLLFAVLFYHACSKDKSCTPKHVSSEVPQIEAYATANGLNTTVHPSGLYYEIIDPGSGAAAAANSKISIIYSGKLLSGYMFDEQTTPNNTSYNPAWSLTDLIEGWQIGIPLIKKGGHIKLIIPSALAYGCEGKGVVPGDAVLFFDIKLVDVQ
ncbi:MAG: FKBP-type peptidyl-prolyl cis-trans isomerase [Chitinophagaceae bacterium]